jgi:endonuclease I
MTMPPSFVVRRSSARLRVLISVFILLTSQFLTPPAAFSAYEVPNPAYAPPANYYSTASGTGSTLRMSLHNIISTMTDISYGDDRYAFPTTDADPNTPGNILLIYSEQSISGVWGSGSNYSREHQMPVSWLGTGDPGNSYTGIESDLFELRPINQSVNSSRGNEAYGPRTSTGTDGQTTNGMWYPGDWDAGEVARSMFYMATRYYDGSTTPSLTNLSIIAGQPANGSFDIGDLPSLLAANYTYGVDNFERNRNEVIYSGWNNALTGVRQVQGNRNPFIDHPEYVWAIFGSGPNDSQISVATPDANGNSSVSVDLGRTIKNGTFGTSVIPVTKTGADPTTFDLTASGSAATIASGTNLLAGTGQPMNYGPQSENITVGLNASTATSGLKTGALTIKDTDLTSNGAGEGSADGNDTINVSGSVLDKRVVTPSQSTVNLGTVITGASVSSGFALTTTGDDNSTTRVNVAGSAAADSKGIAITGTTALFNSATSTSPRTLTGTLSGAGTQAGTLSLAVSTAENGGAGLTGEGTYSAVSVGYSATVLAHSTASLSPSSASTTGTINFGTVAANSGTLSNSFDIANLVTTAGYTAGLNLIGVSATGNNQFSTDATPFTNEAAGNFTAFHILMDTTSTGSFSAVFTFAVADEQDLAGATADPSLTLDVFGQVGAAPEPGSALIFFIGAPLLMRRRRHRM